MKVEIHSHTNMYSSCSVMPPGELFSLAENLGYEALFLTEHHKVWRPEALKRLQAQCEEMRIFPGIEISLESGVDVLVLGANDPVYETLKNPSELFAKACADGYLTIIAHPYRWSGELPEFCRFADAVEVRSCHHFQEERARAAKHYAELNGQAEVWASDAHGLNYLNRFWLETEESFATPHEFRRLIMAGRYACHMNEDQDELPLTYKAATVDELSQPTQTE